MIVYNITFHIDNDVLEKTLGYIKETFIPDSIANGFLHSPCLRKVMHTQEEGSSYAVQFYAENIDTLNDWLRNEGLVINKALTDRFGNKIAGFTTLLEEIDWKK